MVWGPSWQLSQASPLKCIYHAKGIRMVQPSHRIVGDRSETPRQKRVRVPRDRSNRCEEPTNIILFISSPVLETSDGLWFKWDWSSANAPSRRGFELSHLMEIPMIRCTTLMLIATAIVTMSLSNAYGQTRTNQNRNNPKDSDEKPTPPPAHGSTSTCIAPNFCPAGGKTALEYERGKDFDKAKRFTGKF